MGNASDRARGDWACEPAEIAAGELRTCSPKAHKTSLMRGTPRLFLFDQTARRRVARLHACCHWHGIETDSPNFLNPASDAARSWDDDHDHGDQKIQSLTPPALLTPQGPNPFESFRTDHFCATWQPLLTFNNGNEPQQP